MPAGGNDDCVRGCQGKASERDIDVGGKDRDTVRKAGRVGIVGAVVDDHDAKSRRCRGAGDRGPDMPCPEHKNTRCGHQPLLHEATIAGECRRSSGRLIRAERLECFQRSRVPRGRGSHQP